MDIRNLTNEELIKVFEECDYSLSKIDVKYGLYKTESLRLFRRRKINYKEIKSNNINLQKEKYEKNPKLCKHCGKPIPWEKRLTNEYCSSSCAASENNKGVVRNPIGGFKKQERTESKRCTVCGELGCSNEFCKTHDTQQLNSLADHVGFDKTKIGTKEVFNEFTRVRHLIYDLYWNKGYSRIDLGKEFNYTNNLMPSKVLKNTLGIPTRSLSEAVRNSIELNKKMVPSSTRFETNQHISWNGDSVFLRSSYEKSFAERLDLEKITYRVEELRIEYYDSQQDKIRIAIPDFYLPEANEIIEIKSDFTLDIQEMRDKFDAYRKQGYIPRLILENEEIDLENLENLINKKRLDKIKYKNINQFRNKNK